MTIRLDILHRFHQIEGIRETIIDFSTRLFDYEFALSGIPAHLKDQYEAPNSANAYDELFADTDLCILALDEDTPIGMLLSAYERPNDIEVLFVEEKYRNKHVGKVLVEQFHRIKLGHPIFVTVMAWNPSARRFYERNGFIFKEDSQHGEQALKGVRSLLD
ncbi:TPA: GNAT family N-acetyltransferase [Pseudomonas aeruginosa]|nr:GNAT family N-acetyltransferase [Pseudomonas aeruginosa]